MKFELISAITDIETIAVGNRIRELDMLINEYGRGRWRKLKGRGYVRLASGDVRFAELHWYEAHGIGRRLMKIKRYLEDRP